MAGGGVGFNEYIQYRLYEYSEVNRRIWKQSSIQLMNHYRNHTHVIMNDGQAYDKYVWFWKS